MKPVKIMMLLTVTAVMITQSVNAQVKDVDAVLAEYLNIKNALAQDDSNKAVIAARTLAGSIGALSESAVPAGAKGVWKAQQEGIRNGAKALTAQAQLPAQRKAFAQISKGMIALAQAGTFNRTLYLQHCPMAKNSWLNEKEAIENPYYGSEMFACGGVQQTITAK